MPMIALSGMRTSALGPGGRVAVTRVPRSRPLALSVLREYVIFRLRSGVARVPALGIVPLRHEKAPRDGSPTD